MTTLRQQMDNAMVLRGFALRTWESYLAAVTALAKHYHRKPDLLTAEEIQAYLLHLIVERKLAYASVNQASCACRFLFGTVLKRPLERFDIPMAKVPKTLPRLLSREEVSRLFAHAANLRARTLLRPPMPQGCAFPKCARCNWRTSKARPTGCASRCAKARAAMIATRCSRRHCSPLCASITASTARLPGCFRTRPAPGRSTSRRRNACIA